MLCDQPTKTTPFCDAGIRDQTGAAVLSLG